MSQPNPPVRFTEEDVEIVARAIADVSGCEGYPCKWEYEGDSCLGRARAALTALTQSRVLVPWPFAKATSNARPPLSPLAGDEKDSV